LAHEKPPGDGEQADEATLLMLSPERLEPHEKEDISLHVSSLPQDGHTHSSSSSEVKTSSSKVFPHLLHLNS